MVVNKRSLPRVALIAALVLTLGSLAVVRAEAAVLFNDTFESVSMAKWTSNTGVVAQQQEVFAGSWAARATSTSGTQAYAYKTLSSPQNEVYVDLRFKAASQVDANVSIERLRTATSGAILTVFRASDGRLRIFNEVTNVTTTSASTVPAGSWHQIEG